MSGKSSSDEIRFLTYNILQKCIGFQVTSCEYKSERMSIFTSQHINDFDILCLQESFDYLNIRPYRLLQAAYKKGFHYFFRSAPPTLQSDFVSDGGLVILSRYPIVDAEELVFPKSLKVDGYSQKGALFTKIDMGEGKILNVIDIHTQASYPFDVKEIQTGCLVNRVSQFVELRKFIDRLLESGRVDPNELFMLVGDFNTDALNRDFDWDEFYSHFEFDEKIFQKEAETEFDMLLNVLSYKAGFRLKNVYYSHNEEHPVTFGRFTIDENGTKRPTEVALTDERELTSGMSLDYILEIIPNKRKGKTTKLYVKEKSAKTEEFLIKHEKLTQLSDHIGLSCILTSAEPKKK